MFTRIPRGPKAEARGGTPDAARGAGDQCGFVGIVSHSSCFSYCVSTENSRKVVRRCSATDFRRGEMKIKYRIHSAGEINALTSDKPLPECANSHLLPSCGAFSSPWIVGGNAQAVDVLWVSTGFFVGVIDINRELSSWSRNWPASRITCGVDRNKRPPVYWACYTAPTNSTQ